MREYRFTGRFELATSLRLSSGEPGDLADAAVRRRADGPIIVPGTSIAGAFRSFVERLSNVSCKGVPAPSAASSAIEACDCNVCRLFGDIRPRNDPKARASRLVFCDAVVETPKVRVIDGVAIDRVRLAASESKKFDFEAVEPGANLCIEVRGHKLDCQELEWIGSAFRALGAGKLALGGRIAQGFGRLRNAELSAWSRDTSVPEHLIAIVLHEGTSAAAWPDTIDPFPGDEAPLHREWDAQFRLALSPRSTFLVADPEAAIATGFDRAPRGGAEAAELPASSFRGALRSATERILRTLDRKAACDPTNALQCCAVREREAQAHGEPPHERCLTCRVFGNEQWASWLHVNVRRETNQGHAQPFDHVAIDRFTGGARDGLKFDVLATTSGAFDIHLSAPDLPSDQRSWVTGLIALALRDLHEGRWQVGHGAARGHGWLGLVDAPRFSDDIETGIRALWDKVGVAYPGVA